MRVGAALLALVLALSAGCRPLRPAFPGAEGHGASAIGGRGGAVLFVDSLADRGAGTLRAALEASGPRTILFRVGGTITLKSPLVVSSPYVTVAGQSAPGDGIQIRNEPNAPWGLASDSFSSLVIDTHDVVIRYLRIRPGPLTPNPNCTRGNALSRPDGLNTCVDANDIQAIELERNAQRVMLDHLSLFWASDEVVDVNGARDVTLQWSILAEGMDFVLYEGFFGTPVANHGHGTIIGDTSSARAGERNGRLAFHHDLFSLLVDRTPQLNVNCPSPAEPLACASDVVNNVVYDWRGYGASLSNLLGHSFMNVVGNYFLHGPDSNDHRAVILNDFARSPLAVLPDADLGVHWSQNRLRRAGNSEGPVPLLCAQWNETTARWQPCQVWRYKTAAYATPPITTTDAATAQNQVLAQAGASRRIDETGSWLPARDTADTRVVFDAMTGNGRMLESYADFPGWPKLSNGTTPADLDQDGMPDAWEDAHGLDAMHADDALDSDGDGYTNLEEYLNGTPP